MLRSQHICIVWWRSGLRRPAAFICRVKSTCPRLQFSMHSEWDAGWRRARRVDGRHCTHRSHSHLPFLLYFPVRASFIILLNIFLRFIPHPHSHPSWSWVYRADSLKIPPHCSCCPSTRVLFAPVWFKVHVWSCSQFSTFLDSLQPLSLHLITLLSFYRYYTGHCSSDSSHPFSV